LEIKTAPIIPKTTGPIDTFTVGNKTFIPISTIPKTYLPLFKNKTVAPTQPVV